MPFRNEVVGGNALIREAIWSADWEGENAGQGWAVLRDGRAFFSELDISNAQVTLGANGDASVSDLAVRSDVLYLEGRKFSDILDLLPLGTVARGVWEQNSAESASEHLWFALRFQALAGRLYRVTFGGGLSSTVADDNVVAYLRDGGSSFVDTSGTRLGVIKLVQDVGGNDDHTSMNVYIGEFSPGTHYLGVFVNRENGTGLVHGVGNPVNPAVLLVEDIGPADFAPNVAGDTAATTPAFGVQTFDLTGANGGSGPGFEQMTFDLTTGAQAPPVPDTSGLWDITTGEAGEQVYLCSFPDLSTIADTITRIEVSIPNVEERSSTLTRLGISTHPHAVMPTTLGLGDLTDQGMDVELAYNSPIIFELSDSAVAALLTGGARGLAFTILTSVSGNGSYRIKSAYNNGQLAVQLRVYRTVIV